MSKSSIAKEAEIAAKVVATATEAAKKVIQAATDAATETVSQAAATAAETAAVAAALMRSDLSYIKERVTKIEEQLQQEYVTRDQFAPVKALVYGMVSIILTAVVIALVALVVIKK
jgi:hypothetical protein